MDIFKWLFTPADTPFNKAVDKRREIKTRILQGNDENEAPNWLEIIELCQQELIRDAERRIANWGDTYVLLGDAYYALGAGSWLVKGDDGGLRAICMGRAAACIYHWTINREKLHTKNPKNGEYFLDLIFGEFIKTRDDIDRTKEILDQLYEKHFHEATNPEELISIKAYFLK